MLPQRACHDTTLVNQVAYLCLCPSPSFLSPTHTSPDRVLMIESPVCTRDEVKLSIHPIPITVSPLPSHLRTFEPGTLSLLLFIEHHAVLDLLCCTLSAGEVTVHLTYRMVLAFLHVLFAAHRSGWPVL